MKIHEKIQQAFINIEALGLHIPEQFILLNLEYGSYLVSKRLGLLPKWINLCLDSSEFFYIEDFLMPTTDGALSI